MSASPIRSVEPAPAPAERAAFSFPPSPDTIEAWWCGAPGAWRDTADPGGPCDRRAGSGPGTIGLAVHRLSAPRSGVEDGRVAFRGAVDDDASLARALEHARRIARHLGIRRLATQEKLPLRKGRDRAPLAAQGFEPLDESHVFQCRFDAFAEAAGRMAKIVERRLRGRRDRLAIRPLDERGIERARRSLEEASLMDAFDFDYRLGAAGDGISLRDSRTAWRDGRLVGVLLVAATGDPAVYEIPVRWVAGGQRNGSVNCALIHTAVVLGRQRQARAVRFSANPANHPETIQLARRFGGVHVATRRRYLASVTEGAGS